MEECSATDQLNILLKNIISTQRAFNHALNNVKDDSIKPFLKNSLEERHRFLEEIKSMIQQINGAVGYDEDALKHFEEDHRRLKTDLPGDNDISLLEQCRMSEDHILKEYHDAISNHNLSMEMREKLSEHLHSIRNSKEQLGKLEITV